MTIYYQKKRISEEKIRAIEDINIDGDSHNSNYGFKIKAVESYGDVTDKPINYEKDLDLIRFPIASENSDGFLSQEDFKKFKKSVCTDLLPLVSDADGVLDKLISSYDIGDEYNLDLNFEIEGETDCDLVVSLFAGLDNVLNTFPMSDKCFDGYIGIDYDEIAYYTINKICSILWRDD